VLDNYEASQKHFPLQWRENKNAYNIIGTFGSNHSPCVDLSAYKKQTGIDVDYVLLMGKASDDSCHINLVQQLSLNYDSIYSPENELILYRSKNASVN